MYLKRMKLDATNREGIRLRLRCMRDVRGIPRLERWRYGVLYDALTHTPNLSPEQIDVFNTALANPHYNEVRDMLEDAGFEENPISLAVLKYGKEALKR